MSEEDKARFRPQQMLLWNVDNTSDIQKHTNPNFFGDVTISAGVIQPAELCMNSVNNNAALCLIPTTSTASGSKVQRLRFKERFSVTRAPGGGDSSINMLQFNPEGTGTTTVTHISWDETVQQRDSNPIVVEFFHPDSASFNVSCETNVTNHIIDVNTQDAAIIITNPFAGKTMRFMYDPGAIISGNKWTFTSQQIDEGSGLEYEINYIIGNSALTTFEPGTMADFASVTFYFVTGSIVNGVQVYLAYVYLTN